MLHPFDASLSTFFYGMFHLGVYFGTLEYLFQKPLNRDFNAAINILQRGVTLFINPVKDDASIGRVIIFLQECNNSDQVMVLQILVLGFYGHDNLGDEQYRVTFNKLFGPQTLIKFENIDTLSETSLSEIDIVVCGGGDIINGYFMKSIIKLVCNFRGPVYAVSVGFPFHTEAVKYLDVFDHIFVRTMTDYEFGKKHVGANNIDYMPDLAWLLDKSDGKKDKCKKKVAFCLAQPMLYKNPNKNAVIDGVIKTIVRLVDQCDYSVTLIPFNVHMESRKECDVFVCQEVCDRVASMTRCGRNDVSVYIDTDISNVMQVFSEQDLVVGMRYHSIVISAVMNVPFVAISVTNKMKNTMRDFGCIDNVLTLEVDDKFRPVCLDTLSLCNKIWNSVGKRQNCKVDHNLFDKCRSVVLGMKKKKEFVLKRRLREISDVDENIVAMMSRYFDISRCDADEMYRSRGGLPRITSYIDFARMVVYGTTGSLNSPCIWGLTDNMPHEAFCLKEAVNYIHDFHTKNNANAITTTSILESPRVYLCLETASKEDYSQNHRSGWQYVMTGMKVSFDHELHRMTNSPCLVLDDYVDKTFSWGSKTLESYGIIPYIKPWVGFIHHTFHEKNGHNSCERLFSNNLFLESLKHCKCLFAMSSHLKLQLDVKLEQVGHHSIPVYMLCHPTEFPDDKFTLERFWKNKNRKIVQIGGWLRNPYPFYTIKLDARFGICKAVLKGKDMQNVVVPPDMMFQIKKEYEYNTFVQGLVDALKQQVASVEIIPRLDNDAFDKLLTENIVFLNLIDASAVNTVIECAVRNTVIIVNRHPSVEEMLGKGYPGFYDDIQQVPSMVTPSAIEKAYFYLKSMDKTKFKLSTFLKTFENAVFPHAIAAAETSV